jgi:hypothetical protein
MNMKWKILVVVSLTLIAALVLRVAAIPSPRSLGAPGPSEAGPSAHLSISKAINGMSRRINREQSVHFPPLTFGRTMKSVSYPYYEQSP